MKIQREPIYRQIYDHLLSRITAGELIPGMRLSEEQIADELGISRTPVRESMIRLEQDGFLQGRRIAQPSLRDIRESYEIRILLEGHAAAQAAVNMSAEDKRALAKVHKDAQHGEFPVRMRANTRFHEIIVDACDNRQLAELIKKHQTLILFCRQQVIAKRDALCHEHHELLEAIEAGDAERARQLMQDHLQNNLDDFVNRASREQAPL